MLSDGPLSIGIVGAGEITRRVHLPVLLTMPDVRIGWIYDSRPERARALARAYGVPALHPVNARNLPACDVALLAIPVDARGDYLKHFKEAGTAILCEKPFAMTAAEHGRIVADFAPHTLGCGFMRRLYRSTTLLRHIVSSEMLGPLLRIEVSEGNRSKGSGVDASFLDDPLLGHSRGVLMDLGSHSLDLALFIAGARDFEVQSCVKDLDGDIERRVSARIDLQSCGAAGNLNVELDYGVSWLDRQANRICLKFERTTVWSDLAVAAGVFLGNPDAPGDCISMTSPLSGATTYNQAFYLEWRAFFDGLRSQRESLISARSALLTTSLLERLLACNGEQNA